MTLGNPEVEWLIAWYRSACDGDWEHKHGVRITTIDNPGWSLDVDLIGTPHAGRLLEKKLVERSEDDWVFFEASDGVFRSRGAPGNLLEMIAGFRRFVEGQTDGSAFSNS